MLARALETLAGMAVIGFARFVTAVRGNWRDCAPDPRPRVYFANHNSHGDFVLIWTVLPRTLRYLTRPVAGADYWTVSALRRGFRPRTAVAKRPVGPVTRASAAMRGPRR